MATSPDVVREELAVVTAAASADLAAVTANAPLEAQVAATLDVLPLLVPAYYDAAGSLAVAWYDEIRDESQPTSTYAPNIIGDAATDWIEREVAKFQRSIEGDLEQQVQRMMDETIRLMEKEVARGYRDTILGNTRTDGDAVGWSRIARPGACKMCVMLADRGAVFSKATANFAAHADCHCAARPEFRNGDHGPEATAEQYIASTKTRTPGQRARLREYLNQHYPAAPG